MLGSFKTPCDSKESDMSSTHFTKVLSTSYVSGAGLSMPASFARNYLTTSNHWRLTTENGGAWAVTINKRQCSGSWKADINGGWTKFRTDYGLAAGDEIKVEFIEAGLLKISRLARGVPIPSRTNFEIRGTTTRRRRQPSTANTTPKVKPSTRTAEIPGIKLKVLSEKRKPAQRLYGNAAKHQKTDHHHQQQQHDFQKVEGFQPDMGDDREQLSLPSDNGPSSDQTVTPQQQETQHQKHQAEHPSFVADMHHSLEAALERCSFYKNHPQALVGQPVLVGPPYSGIFILGTVSGWTTHLTGSVVYQVQYSTTGVLPLPHTLDVLEGGGWSQNGPSLVELLDQILPPAPASAPSRTPSMNCSNLNLAPNKGILTKLNENPGQLPGMVGYDRCGSNTSTSTVARSLSLSNVESMHMSRDAALAAHIAVSPGLYVGAKLTKEVGGQVKICKVQGYNPTFYCYTVLLDCGAKEDLTLAELLPLLDDMPLTLKAACEPYRQHLALATPITMQLQTPNSNPSNHVSLSTRQQGPGYTPSPNLQLSSARLNSGIDLHPLGSYPKSPNAPLALTLSSTVFNSGSSNRAKGYVEMEQAAAAAVAAVDGLESHMINSALTPSLGISPTEVVLDIGGNVPVMSVVEEFMDEEMAGELMALFGNEF